MLAFIPRLRADKAWFPAGPASSYPDINPENDEGGVAAISDPRPCVGADAPVPGCKVFAVPNGDVAAASEVSIAPEEGLGEGGPGLKDQVMVFRYRGRFHAVDHVSGILSRDLVIIQSIIQSISVADLCLAMSALVLPAVQRHAV